MRGFVFFEFTHKKRQQKTIFLFFAGKAFHVAIIANTIYGFAYQHAVGFAGFF